MSTSRQAFAFDRLLRIGSNLDVRRDDYVLYLDNFYEDPDLVLAWLRAQSYPLWKYFNPATRNGVDYNDCRLAHRMPGLGSELERRKFALVLQLCQQYYWRGRYHFDFINEFNVFQTINVFDNSLQHFPHVDSSPSDADDCTTLNMLIYLNKEENGGTAVYKGEVVANDESMNLLVPYADKFEIERIIPAKFNRCVIFPGNRLHGAYIDDYRIWSAERNSWRYSQILFLRPATDKMHKMT